MMGDFVFDVFPQLETKRFILRKIELEDAEDIFSYFSQDILTEYYDLETFDEVSEAIQLIHTFHQRYEEKTAIRWGIALRESNQLIGTCGFHQIEPEHSKVEMGYELHPLFWRRGAMTEVASAIIQYGFDVMLINRIEAFYDPNNVSSAQLLKKLGFHVEGILKQRFYEKGKYVDAAIASLLSSDYKN